MTDENLENEDGQVLSNEAAPKGENEAPETAEGEGQELEKPKQSRELDALYAERRRLEQRLAEQDQINRAIMERLESMQPKEEPKPLDRPSIDDFESEDDYHIALADWRWEARERERLEREQREAAERQQREQSETINQAYWSMHNSGREKYTDYDSVIASAPLTNPMVGMAVARSELAADVSYYLGQHHEVASRLDQMDPIDAAREIGRIEAQLSKPQRKPVSEAPASPQRDPGATSRPATSSSGRNPALSPEENIRRRQAELAGRA